MFAVFSLRPNKRGWPLPPSSLSLRGDGEIKSKQNQQKLRGWSVGCVHSVMSKRERENMNRVGKVLDDDRR